MTEVFRQLQSGHSEDGRSPACPSRLRFAVGAFDTWEQLRGALRDLELRGMPLDSFNCLALREAFAGKTIVGPSSERVGLVPLAFPQGPAPLTCTSGPLAECLAERLRAGAPTLGRALGHWLLERHAARFEEMVTAGRLLFWIGLRDPAAERAAYEALLAYSSDTVGVHDLR